MSIGSNVVQVWICERCAGERVYGGDCGSPDPKEAHISCEGRCRRVTPHGFRRMEEMSMVRVGSAGKARVN